MLKNGSENVVSGQGTNAFGQVRDAFEGRIGQRTISRIFHGQDLFKCPPPLI
ncbi:MAG: hypothetical protein ABL999_06720 [Pyrinomonadaceae bacterium]